MVSSFLRRTNSNASTSSQNTPSENESPPSPDTDDPFDDALLEPPLLPPRELHPGRLYALYEFSGPDPSQCDLEYDDAVVLLNDDDSYWWLIKKVKDGKIGFAPAECLETPGERLARLNCWKNEELERVTKEENRKASKLLLSLTRKASKIARRNPLKTVVFNETIDYSETVFVLDSEDELYDTELSDNDTLDGVVQEEVEGPVGAAESVESVDLEEHNDPEPESEFDGLKIRSPLKSLGVRSTASDSVSTLTVESTEEGELLHTLPTLPVLPTPVRSLTPPLLPPVTIKRAPTPPSRHHPKIDTSFRKSQDMEAVLELAKAESGPNLGLPTKLQTMLSFSIGDYLPLLELGSETATPTKFLVLNLLHLDEESDKDKEKKSLGLPVNLFGSHGDVEGELERQIREWGNFEHSEGEISQDLPKEAIMNTIDDAKNNKNKRILSNGLPVAQELAQGPPQAKKSPKHGQFSGLLEDVYTPDSSFTGLLSSLRDKPKLAEGTVFDLKKNLSSPATIGEPTEYVDANRLFSSLLEGYHPDIGEMFSPLFGRVDILGERIEELKLRIL